MSRFIALGALLSITLATTSTRAYTVGTAFSEPCHERISAAALEDFVERLAVDVPVVVGERNRRIAQHFIDLYGYDQMSPQAEAVLFALIMGVRDPDSEGVSPTDLSGSRYLHANTEGQAQHALRRVEDNGPDGDAAAVAGIRESIELTLADAQNWFARPTAEQTREVDYFLESYGAVRVRVWAPAFYLGRALHTLQDSFSHALRTPDMHRIVHVFNYIEAIGDGHQEQRDGLRHSGEMDACYQGGASSSLFLAAREASTQVVEVVLGNATLGRLGDASATLDNWLMYEPGCTLDNGYCGNPFAETAALNATAPAGTCGVSHSRSGKLPLLVLLCFLLAARRRAVVVVSVLAILVSVGCKPTPLLEEEFESRAPCGGDPSGTWYFSATSEAVPANNPPQECPLLRDDVRRLYSGRIELRSDGTMLPGATLRRHRIQIRDATCDPECENNDGCVRRGDVCHCLEVLHTEWLPGAADAPVRWSVEGQTLEFTGADGSVVFATGYCVAEDRTMDWSSTISPSIGQRLQRIPE